MMLTLTIILCVIAYLLIGLGVLFLAGIYDDEKWTKQSYKEPFVVLTVLLWFIVVIFVTVRLLFVYPLKCTVSAAIKVRNKREEKKKINQE